MADVLDAVSQKSTLLQLKGDAILHENITDTFKETEQRIKNCGPEEDVVSPNPTS